MPRPLSGGAKNLHITQYGSTGFGVTGWANAAVVEGLADGGLVLSSYVSDMLFQTGSSRTTRMSINASSGNVKIGGGSATSALLELSSTTGAFLPPRMTTTQRDALTAVDGMILYNSTTGALNYRKAGAWVAI